MNLKAKLTSRKLWAAIAGIIVGLVVAFGGDGETVETVAGSVMSVVSAVIYILAEAGIDKASANTPMHNENMHSGEDTGTAKGAGENDTEGN